MEKKIAYIAFATLQQQKWLKQWNGLWTMWLQALGLCVWDLYYTRAGNAGAATCTQHSPAHAYIIKLNFWNGLN